MALGTQIYTKSFRMDRSGGVAALFGSAIAASLVVLGGAVGYAQSPSGVSAATDTGSVLAARRADGANIEISLMLDVTRSMDGDKLSSLKEAANDFIDSVVLDGDNSLQARIALVPYSESVRLPEVAYQNAVGLTANASNMPVSFTKDVRQWHWYHGWQTVSQTNYKTKCLIERMGPQAFTDAAPGPGAYVSTVSRAKAPAKCGQASTNSIVPLTSNKSVLESAINKLTASSTRAAGHLGTAWAWYTLSPKWNSLWASAAHEASAYRAKGTQKFAILMSDGAFNTQYTEDGFTSAAVDAPNGSSNDQARKLCTAMKASGVIVYTVGLNLGPDSSVAKTLAQCATDAAKALSAADGKDLKQAFRSIARDITKSGLSS